MCRTVAPPLGVIGVMVRPRAALLHLDHTHRAAAVRDDVRRSRAARGFLGRMDPKTNAVKEWRLPGGASSRSSCRGGRRIRPSAR